MTTNNEQRSTINAAAVRHVVYRDLLDMLPVASLEQALRFVSNLKLMRDAEGVADPGQYDRMLDAALCRFLHLCVTPDIGEASAYRGRSLREIETAMAARYGDRLCDVAGFYRRNENAAWRLNLPFKCVLYGYGNGFHMHRRPLIDAVGPVRMPYHAGILCQPIDRLDSYFLLSSAKFDGPKAVRLTPRDQQYFTQFEEVAV